MSEQPMEKNTLHSQALASGAVKPNTGESQKPVPLSILKKSSTEMEIRWNDGKVCIIPFLDLRVDCQCAQCVDEWTREQRVSRKNIKPDIKPLKLEPVGLYAVQINWSDGHNSSIYSYEQLYRLGLRFGV